MDHCCDAMRGHVERTCDVHPDPFDCPDKLIHYSPRLDEYGIVVHNGGTGTIEIRHCPWCGTRLPESKRDRWFDELKRLGYDDPWTDPEGVPEQYQSDEWYRQSE